MLYKVCAEENGEYVDAKGNRCNLLICNEVIFPAEEKVDAEGKVQKRIPTPTEKGYIVYPSLQAALAALGLQKAEGQTYE